MSQRLLLDTHALLWALSDPRRLPARVAKIVRDPDSDVFVSSVTTWEIAIKAAIGKIDADVAVVARAAHEAGFEELAVTIDDTLRVRDLPGHHRDPFDRLLIAQALAQQMGLVTHDSAIGRYPVRVIWN